MKGWHLTVCLYDANSNPLWAVIVFAENETQAGAEAAVLKDFDDMPVIQRPGQKFVVTDCSPEGSP